ELSNLPPRLEGVSYLSERRRKELLAARFAAGSNLKARLDDVAGTVLDPSSSFFDRLDKSEKAMQGLEKAKTDLKTVLDSESEVETTLVAQEALKVKAWGTGKDLLDLKGESPLRVARKQTIDLVVTGTASPVGDYVEVEMHGYDSNIGREIFMLLGYADASDPAPLAAEFAEKLLTILAASPYGEISIQASPPTAQVLLDGKSIESRPATSFVFTEASVAVDVWAPGFGSHHEDVSLLPGRSSSLSITLPRADYGSASLQTNPLGATVLVNGRPVEDKLLIPLSGLRNIAVASAPGYENGTKALPASGTGSFALVLRKSDGIGPGGRSERAKNDFYWALGFVVIAMPLSSLTMGVSSIYGDAFYLSTVSGASHFATESVVANVAFWTSAALAAASIGNAIWRLVTFISTGNGESQ
ncbi:MAG: hypothetical protein WCL50_13995, partial [Spirochaetota bacterium]